MALWVNTGLDTALRVILNKQVGIAHEIRLFRNNYIPVLTSLPANFTDPVLPGYAPILLVPANWVGGVAGGLGSYAYPALTWTIAAYAGPVQTIFGYYAIDTVSGKLLYAEAFAAPFAVPLTGGVLNLILNPLDQNM